MPDPAAIANALAHHLRTADPGKREITSRPLWTTTPRKAGAVSTVRSGSTSGFSRRTAGRVSIPATRLTPSDQWTLLRTIGLLELTS